MTCLPRRSDKELWGSTLLLLVPFTAKTTNKNSTLIALSQSVKASLERFVLPSGMDLSARARNGGTRTLKTEIVRYIPILCDAVQAGDKESRSAILWCQESGVATLASAGD